VTGYASPATPLVGTGVALVYQVTDKNLTLGFGVTLTITLPDGFTYGSAGYDRGQGCKQTSATQVVCALDFLSGVAPAAHVQIYGTVTKAGALPIAANVTYQNADPNPADNTLTLTLNAAAPSSPATGASTTGVPVGLTGGAGVTKTTSAASDRKAPTAHAIRSSARRGTVAKLRFRIYDDSGVAKATATVRRNGRKLGVVRTGFGPVAVGGVYYVGWRVPRSSPKGKYTFCVVASDRARHSSNQTCAALTLR
jgi:hypothetical protein